MQRLKAIIVDDEKKLIELLHSKLSHPEYNVNVVATATTIDQAYNQIITHKPQIVFLDISLRGESGFDLLHKFKIPDFETIFVTGYSEYALDAIRLSALDYLLKPVKNEDLKKAIEKYRSKNKPSQSHLKYGVLQANLTKNFNTAKIVVPTENIYHFLLVKDIIYCKSDNQYTEIHMSNNETIISSYNIGSYRDKLENFGFFQVHRSYLVNLSKVKRYFREGYVELDDGTTAPVSRRKKDKFLEQMEKQLGQL